MAAGSVKSINLAGREFTCPADADWSVKVGGYETEVIANGNRTSKQRKTAVPWSASGGTINIDDVQGDQEYLQALADGFAFFPVSLTKVDGTVWSGTGQITGELTVSTATGLASLSIMGEGILSQQ